MRMLKDYFMGSLKNPCSPRMLIPKSRLISMLKNLSPNNVYAQKSLQSKKFLAKDRFRCRMFVPKIVPVKDIHAKKSRIISD